MGFHEHKPVNNHRSGPPIVMSVAKYATNHVMKSVANTLDKNQNHALEPLVVIRKFFILKLFCGSPEPLEYACI